MQDGLQEAQPRAGRVRGRGAAPATRTSSDVQYERGRQAIERAHWAVAVQQFTELAEARGERADAALYWRAYAFDKMNRAAEAFASIAELGKSFPTSRWLPDARALELQVRQRSGQPVP